MSMKISTVDEDMEVLGQLDPRRNISSLSGRYPNRNTQQKKQTPHLIYISIIAMLVFVLIYMSVGGGKQEGGLQKKLEKLQQQLEKVNQKTDAAVQQTQSVKNDIININKPQNNAQPKQPARPAPPPPAAPQTISKNRAKNEYMTPQLQKVSDKRRQTEGLVKAKGTVSQMNYLKKNTQGKTIDELLYDQKSREGRKAFHKQRAEFLNGRKNLQSIYLASFNNKIDQSRNAEQEKAEAEEWQRIDKIWNFEKYPEELPMCLVIPGYNNNAKFRIQYNLNSIFQQNYTNYFAVIINDASTDNSDQVYRRYLDFYNIDKKTYAYIENNDRKTALENIYTATHDYCSPDSIAVNIDADDQFIGKNVLKIFNAAYQAKKAGVVYSNFYWYDQGRNIMLGFTSEYTENDKKNANYRKAPQRFSHLRSYRTELFLKINAKDSFQDDQGKFFTSAYDMAMYFPLMELSCGRVNKIEGFHYLYNINTGLNDYAVDRNKQVRIDQTVRRRPKLNCSLEFDQRMKKL